MEGNVLIVGMGLIGGSLALCIKEEHPHATIIGYDVNQKELRLAKTLGVIDEMAQTFEHAAEKADLIIISTPVTQTEKIMKILHNTNLKQGVIITDTGSTKGQIMKAARPLSEKGIPFIGGHPMAGSHKSGVSAAKKILFENAFYMFTPSENIEDHEIQSLEKWLGGTRAKFLIVPPKEHDELTGMISHFPHIIAASLVHQAKDSSQEHPYLRRLAAGGFRDITRIASSSPVMWKDITMQNSQVLMDILEKWKIEMEEVIHMVKEKDAEELYRYFYEAKVFRDELPVLAKGAIPAFYDLYIDIPDYPGVISEVTAYLAEEKISLTNIRILETREDVYGVLVISFQTIEDRERAVFCLKEKTAYELFID
ncbi:prephenate dehydrogenase [[Bacillus] enclensis]|uniref:Prephenate dehydrogenase n=1 Tax=[Bacillus] enclensis TaxID=1402860 RepID=A0A0V8HLZ9_9BACI|nr:prephenate dehydrogenase [[Bacillus] enclensis]KSU63464.1 prephenate dehydrogenase [[Bacillus] enclensis]SCB84403.1 prephenate dehydrogenase [[Bacillus] enclensis]